MHLATVIWKKIITHIKVHNLTINGTVFPFERMIPALPTVQQMIKKSATREEGRLQLINIGTKLQGTQKVTVKFIKNMLESFPPNDLGEIIKEDDKNYIHFTNIAAIIW